MKKRFGHMKKSYEEDLEFEDLDLDDMDLDEEICDGAPEGVDAFYEGEEVYEDEESYEEEEVYEDEASYEDEESYEGEEIYEDEDFEEEAYTEEEDTEDIDEEADLDDLDESDYEGDYEELDDDAYEGGADSIYVGNANDETEEDEEEVLPWSAMEDKNIFQKLWYSLLHMSTMDKVITTTGILVLILALVTGTIYVDGLRKKTDSTPTFEELAGMDGITIIGGDGLLAISDAEAAKHATVDIIEDENKDYDENEYTKDVQVELNLTSVEKDLKVKFVNDKTNKLIGNVPFSVEITNPDKKTETWTDDDMDGIIYKAKLEPGKYTVAMNELTDEKYKDYGINTEAQTITVRKEIAYEKIDVSDEIRDDKDAGEGEDGDKNNDKPEESTLQDTVEWVESTRTVLEAGYTAVNKNTIPDPLATAKSGIFVRMGSLNLSDVTLKIGESTTIALPAPEGVTFSSPVYTPADPSVVSISGDKIVALKAGSTRVDVSVTGTKSGDASTGDGGTETYTGSFTVTVGSDSVAVTGITLSSTTLELNVGGESTLTAAIAPENATNKELTWSSTNTEVATVTDGKVVALKEGTATIKVASVSQPDISANCSVTVKAKEETRSLTLDKTTVAATPGSKIEIKATIKNSEAGGDVSGTITYAADKNGIVDVSIGTAKDGVTPITITPKKKGTVVLTFGVQGSSLTAKCTITVEDRSITLDKSTMSIMASAKQTIKATITATGGEVKAESSDTKVATVTVAGVEKAADGKSLVAKVEITGVKSGTSTITVTHAENGVTIKQTMTVKVWAKETKLVDANKQQLYVLVAENQYREANYADYYNSAIKTFYLKTEGKIKYTGWQTLDGKTYYFDASGKYVTGEQVIQGAKYTFASDGSLVTGSGSFGIDVSKWNGNIDWNAVKNSGVNYVIIRSGYRGSTGGGLFADPKFEANIKGANAAGIKVGIYFFSQAVNKTEAVEEASMVLQQVKNHKISYPIFLDVEDVAGNGRADNLDKATRTEVIKAFCETIQNSGYTAGVYANKSWLTDKIDTGQLSRYKIWLAQYASQPTYTGRYDMWQYKATGKINGINGDVDLNISYLGY